MRHHTSRTGKEYAGLVCAAVWIMVCCATITAAPGPLTTAGTVRIATRPIVANKQNLAAAALKKTNAALATRIALAGPSFTPQAAARYGWRVVSRTGDVVTLAGPAFAAPYLGAVDGILSVKRPSKVYPLMDTVRKYCAIDQAHGTRDGGIGRTFSGRGVLFGIIDTDFDVHHPAFADSTGRTRFIALWDQNDSSGAAQNRFGYGTIKDGSGLEADSLFGMRNRHHGTTMASYGVGGEKTTPFYGAAPEALIAGVCMSDLDDGIIDGLHWLFSIADSLSLPCVVNMSLGYHDGPHDGTSLVDRTIDSLSGPGRIVVGSAGNDGDKKAHVTFDAAPGDTAGTWFTGIGQVDSTGAAKAVFGIELWGESGKPFSAAILLLDTVAGRLLEGAPVLTADTTVTFEPDTLVFPASGRGGDTVILEALVERASPLNGKPHVQVTVSATTVSFIPGVWITASTAATIQAWNMTKRAFASLDMPGFLDGDTVMSVNELGGTARSNITVGAYTSKLKYTLFDGRVIDWKGDDLPWHFLCGYSSHGPTADGRIKPDITAPGSDLIGAMARDASGGNIVIWPDTATTMGRYWASGGTSASAPVVAGIIALMLEADPLLTPQAARQFIQESASADATTGPILTPNILWGAGRVNGIGALSKQLGIGVTQRIAAGKRRPGYTFSPVSQGRYRLTGKTIEGVSVELLSLTGRTVHQIAPGKNGLFSLPRLPAGVWVMQATGGGKRVCATRLTQLAAPW
ncbi:MAG: S8 family peptidase [Chitinispirillaceae bacterium]|nr:S8 family peptidase [Chitinispirillaceae bacterium]